MTSTLAVNVDVDGLALYHAIHGLPTEQADDIAWTVGVPRFMALFESHGLKATFFAVASDLERPGPRAVAKEVVQRGHELASHSWSHPYDLIHQSPAQIEDELARAETALSELRGRAVAGFRAPGYNMSEVVFALLAARGYRYDSSLFPCPLYYAARAAIIGLMRLWGRHSQSIVGDLKAPFGEPMPYHRADGLWEVPMTVLPGSRFPVIGTSLTMLGARGVGMIAPMLRRRDFVNLEFHALDLLDHTDVPGSPLLAHQTDLAVSVAKKRAAFSAAFRACAGAYNNTMEGLCPKR